MVLDVAVDQKNEIELIQRAQLGDRDAFGSLVSLHRENVINVVYRMCGETTLAEDAAQTAFINAWKHLPTYRPQNSFHSWLYRIAINAALDMLRREKPTVNIDDLSIRNHQHIESQVEDQQMAQQIQKAVLSLPEASRAVLILREYQEMRYQEIAETLEIPIGTVMSRLNYARKCLMEELKELMEEA
jgi:RNA polymerase sigma-70 factor (ECF subfamily)